MLESVSAALKEFRKPVNDREPGWYTIPEIMKSFERCRSTCEEILRRHKVQTKSIRTKSGNRVITCAVYFLGDGALHTK